MAAHEALGGHPNTEQGTVALNRFQGVGGTGRMETAPWAEPRPYAVAVAPDQERQYSAH